MVRFILSGFCALLLCGSTYGQGSNTPKIAPADTPQKARSGGLGLNSSVVPGTMYIDIGEAF